MLDELGEWILCVMECMVGCDGEYMDEALYTDVVASLGR
jgi:hypothetical protein